MKLAAFITAVILASASFATAADTKKDAPKGPAPKEKQDKMHLPLKGTVLSVSPRVLTLKGAEGKEPRKFGITKDSVILKGDKPAGLDEVKAGMDVTGSFVREGDKDTLTKLQLKPESKSKSDDKPGAKK